MPKSKLGVETIPAAAFLEAEDADPLLELLPLLPLLPALPAAPGFEVPEGAEVTVPVPADPASLIRAAQLPVGETAAWVVAEPLKSQAEAPLPAARCCS